MGGIICKVDIYLGRIYGFICQQIYACRLFTMDQRVLFLRRTLRLYPISIDLPGHRITISKEPTFQVCTSQAKVAAAVAAGKWRWASLAKYSKIHSHLLAVHHLHSWGCNDTWTRLYTWYFVLTLTLSPLQISFFFNIFCIYKTFCCVDFCQTWVFWGGAENSQVATHKVGYSLENVTRRVRK